MSMLNVDCDMFVSNPKIILQGVFTTRRVEDEQECAFVQCPQKFYNALKDDPFGNQMTMPFTEYCFHHLCHYHTSIILNFFLVTFLVHNFHT